MRILIAVFLVISFTYAKAQTAEDMHLMQQIKQHPDEDTFRVNRLNELSNRNTIKVSARDTAAMEALSISKKIHYPEGEMQALMSLGDIALSRGNTSEALSLARQAYEIAFQHNNKNYQVTTLSRKAIYKFNTSEGKTAINDLLKAESIAQNLQDKRALANCQRAIGDFYILIVVNYPLSMEWILKSIATAEKAQCVPCLENSWASMGNLYSVLGDQQNALLYLQKTQKSLKARRVQPQAIMLNTIGERYRFMGNYPEALKYYREALAMENDSLSREIYLSNISDVYVRMDSIIPALTYGFASLRLAEKLNDIIGVAWINGILARGYLKKNMPDSALFYAGKGILAAEETNNLEYMRDNADALAHAYFLKKNFEKAYKYQSQYITYRDSILNENVTNKTNLLQFNYQKEKTQAHIDLLTQQKKNQRSLLVAALVVLTMIILSAILLLRNNRHKQKANKKLEKSYNNMELLGDIGRNITSSLSLEAVIRTVYDQVNTLMDANIFGLGIFNAKTKMIEFPATFESGTALAPYSHSIDDKNRFASICLDQNKEIVMGNLGDEYKDYVQNLETPHQGALPASLIFLPLISKGKNIGVITVQSFEKNAYTDYHLFMLRNIGIYTAIALENATTYGKLNQTLENLKQTQSKLIQSEKMASLGELTAGIAHEIQNPLNFVNNFSEVNTDLANDLQSALDNGNLDEAGSLAANIIENNERIVFHGNRADSIVKGMLQHSRSSSGVKEPTDINNLCDEFLRLAYHGLRAKDKSFNANFITDFDPEIQKIDVVPQDMGRAMLNLITNAFYEVDNKKKINNQPAYEPKVKVSTKLSGKEVVISVSDNGNGISKEIEEKIFQPFFTTKPTGQGTGLGLSMCYDIITKGHHGDLVVTSVPGESTTFKIVLPINNQYEHSRS